MLIILSEFLCLINQLPQIQKTSTPLLCELSPPPPPPFVVIFLVWPCHFKIVLLYSSIRTSLDSHDHVEVDAAIYATSRFCAKSQYV